MKNGRYNLHGRKSPETNQNALKHGIYASGYTDEEIAFLDELDKGVIADEIRLLRVRIRRAVSIGKLIDLNPKASKGFFLEELSRGIEIDGRQIKRAKKSSYKRPDIDAIICALIGKLTRLERLQFDMIMRGAVLDDDPEESARQIQAALAEMGEITKGSRWEE